MSLRPHSRPRLYMFLLTLCFVPGISVVAALSWLKTQPDNLVFLLTGIAATVTILASLALAILHDRSMGEWERSNSRFSVFWGDAIGTSLVALLLSVPAFREAIVYLITSVTGRSVDPQAVILAFVAGFIAVVIARSLCMAAISIGWTFWKSRPAHEA